MNKTKFVEFNDQTIVATDYFTTELIDTMKLNAENGGIIMEIPRDLIETKDYLYALSFLDSIEKSKIKSDIEIKIGIGGYGEDQRELYEIPEVKEYLEHIFNKHKRAICLTNVETIRTFLITKCLVEIVSGDDVSKDVAISKELANRFFKECMTSLSDEDELIKFSSKIREALGINNEIKK